MPRLTNSNAANVTGHFGFSGERLENLTGSSKYTLVSIAVDRSPSVSNFIDLIVECLKKVIRGQSKSPHADSLLVRVISFAGDVQEVHGFKLLKDIDLTEYDKIKQLGSSTALYDATHDIISKTQQVGEHYANDGGLTVNAHCFVITDGENVRSIATTSGCRQLLQDMVRKEDLESVVMSLVGVNTSATPGLSKYLQDFKDEVGFRDFIDAATMDDKTVAKIEGWISKSVSSSSQACGTGGPSQAVVF